MLIDIIFDHQDFVVLNKPCGIAVQDEEHRQGIIPIACAQLGLERLWLVHRLDKVTSGLLILAKSEKAAAEFGRQFEAHLIQKFYLALAPKRPKKKQGTVSGGMKKVRDGLWMLDESFNQRATTQFFSFSLMPNMRLFVVKPLSGKTHQIRVMMKSLGSPILGDSLYKGEASDRTYLHAYGLKFEYQQHNIELLCPPKEGGVFISVNTQSFISSLALPWTLNWPKVKHSA